MKAVLLRWFIAFLVLLSGLSGAVWPAQAHPAAQAAVYHEDFEDGNAQDWDLIPGWEIRPDEGNSVLAGQGHVTAGPNLRYDDFVLAFRIKVVQGNVLLNYRTDHEARYLIDFQEGSSVLNKQAGPGAFQDGLAAAQRGHARGVWHPVEIRGQGGALQMAVDGQVEWTYTDPEPFLEGGFTFEPLEDALVYFDDVTVTLLPTSAYISGAGSTPADDLEWVRTGGPLGGLGYDVRMRPQEPDQMLVTDANAGVFLSRDGGQTWVPSNQGITTRSGSTGDIIPIFCLTIDPTHPDTVWAGTQGIRGIFKSADGGQTWEKRDQGILENEGLTFRGFAIDPVHPDTVYAAAELSSFVWNGGQERMGREFDLTAGVVYKTTDGGMHWDAVWRGDNLARYVWIDPRDSNVIYVSTGIFDREAKNSDPAAGSPGGEGVLKSSDGGRTWTPINTGLGNLYVGSLYLHPANPDVLLAGTGNNAYPQNQGVYRTQDGGTTWKQVLPGETITAVEFAASDPAVAYAAGSVSVYRSSDGGLTWIRAAGSPEAPWGAPGTRAGFPIDLQVDPRNPERVFANAYGGGNFLSEDGGKTWVDASRGYTGAQVRALAVDPAQPGRLLAATRSGLFLSSDGGATWAGQGNPPIALTEWNAVAVDPSDPAHWVAGANQNTVLANRGKDGWQRAFNLADAHVGWKAIAFAPSDPTRVYAGTAGFYSAGTFNNQAPGAGIFRSQDGGRSWAPVNDALSADAFVSGLAVDPRDPERVYAATGNHGLLETTDGGVRWQAVRSGLPETGATAVGFRPGHPDVIFAGFERQGLWISADGGQTWTLSARGMMPEASIAAIAFDPTGAQETVYTADSTGVAYRSQNAGQTWERINQGLTNRALNALAISSDGQHLYAATEGGGVYRLDLNGQAPATVLDGEIKPEATASAPGTRLGPSQSGTGQPSAGLPKNGLCPGAMVLPAAGIVLGSLRRRRL